MPGPITIFSARKIITMDPAVEEATHVAVRDGIILELGTLDECAVWGPYTLDDRFGDSILVPGLIESHAHLLDGLLWAKAEYVGPIDRRDPSGKQHKALKSVSALVRRLKEIEATTAAPGTPLIGWGVDPSLNDLVDPITRHDLDQVSKDRPIFLLHASCHLAYVNSATLELANYAAIKAPGVLRDASGTPTGELQEMAAMMAAIKAVASDLVGASTDSTSPKSPRHAGRRPSSMAAAAPTSSLHSYRQRLLQPARRIFPCASSRTTTASPCPKSRT